MTTTAPVLTAPDNGYFEVWTRPCGHRYRVTTEYAQDLRRLRRPGMAPSMREPEGANLRSAAAARPCRQCEES
jgi:hypothetical protein